MNSLHFQYSQSDTCTRYEGFPNDIIWNSLRIFVCHLFLCHHYCLGKFVDIHDDTDICHCCPKACYDLKTCPLDIRIHKSSAPVCDYILLGSLGLVCVLWNWWSCNLVCPCHPGTKSRYKTFTRYSNNLTDLPIKTNKYT